MRLFDWLKTPKGREIWSKVKSENLDPLVTDGGREKVWCETYTGRRVYPTAMTVDMVDFEDIAHSLAHQCRYNGHTTHFYSVAEHCVHMADYTMDLGRSPKDALHALLHDACEAYIGDIPRPIKCAIPRLKEVENKIDLVIAEVFDLPVYKPDWLEELDARIVVDERAQAKLPSNHVWVHDVLEPLGVKIGFWKPADAKHLFVRRYRVLTDMIKNGDDNE